LGHKEVYYQVDEKANEQKDKGYRVSLGMIGAFSPYEDMTYEKFK
jgi:hypothetical protein